MSAFTMFSNFYYNMQIWWIDTFCLAYIHTHRVEGVRRPVTRCITWCVCVHYLAVGGCECISPPQS